MKLTIVVHEAGEGGYWAEVPAITGCVSQGESLDELLLNVREAVKGCLSVDVLDIPVSETDKVMDTKAGVGARISIPVHGNADLAEISDSEL